jgi:hypothetical protein
MTEALAELLFRLLPLLRIECRIAVERACEVVAELDDELGEVVSGCGLAGEEEGARREVELRVLVQAIVEHDDVQRVQQLPLVFEDAIDLRVENVVGINSGSSQPLNESQLGLPFRGGDCEAKRFGRRTSR